MILSNSFRALAVSLLFWLVVVLAILSGKTGEDRQHANLPDTEVEPAATDAASSASLAESEVSAPSYSEFTGNILKGESFDESLQRLSVPQKARNEIIQAFLGTLDFKRLLPGNNFSVVLDEEGDIINTTFVAGPTNIYSVTKTDDGLAASRLPVTLEQKTVRLSGSIDSSLFAAFLNQGEDPKIIHAFANIFSSKIDFNTETQQGDRFEVIVDKFYSQDGQFVGYGPITMARYEQEDKILEGFYYSSRSTKGYFDAHGEELGAWFIRSPIPFGRVTSQFTNSRRHPILGISRPHHGVDLAAPTGTPIMAASEGRVEFIGVKGGFGKQIILAHANGYRTHYGHLSRFNKDLRAGSRVDQKDIIGYVGSTGLSTGPHLDYRIEVNGVFKNPFSLEFKPKSVLQGAELAQFSRVKEQIFQRVASVQKDNLLAVKNIVLKEDNEIKML